MRMRGLWLLLKSIDPFQESVFAFLQQSLFLQVFAWVSTQPATARMWRLTDDSKFSRRHWDGAVPIRPPNLFKAGLMVSAQTSEEIFSWHVI